MGSLEDKVYLHHILDAINTVQQFCRALTADEFYKNALVQSATIRQLEIIGEATAQMSPDFKNEHPEIPWDKMADMRNRLIHGYFGIDLSIVWSTVQESIPGVKTFVEKLYHQLEG